MADDARNLTPDAASPLGEIAPDGLGAESAGLTPRTALVIFYGAFILMPASLYLRLVAGQTMLGPISFIALILWVEFCRLGDKPLTKAEAFIVYSVSSIAAGQYLFYNYALFPAYFRTSEITRALKAELADGTVKSFADLAPSWWAPPAEVIGLRTFFHASWLLPISIAVLVWIFHVMADVSMGLVGRELFIRVEKLPFPFARPTAAACEALTEPHEEQARVFTVAGLIGTAWGLLVYWPVAMGRKIVNYPIPWVDLNSRIHSFARGVSFGLATDILAFTGGFIIPFRVVLSMFLGALTVQAGNALFVRAGYFKRFVEGMPIAQMRINELDVWASPLIGAMLAAGVLQILSHPKAIISAIGGLARTARGAAPGGPDVPGDPVGETRPVSMKWLLVIFLGSVVGCVALFKLLIPDFPLLFIAPFALLWSVLFSLIDIRAVGTTGFRVEPPYVREGLIVGYSRLSSYANPAVWFAPWPVALGASDWVQNFKVCELVRCRARDYIKAALIAVPVGMVANFIYMSIFWRLAPIPSSTYPFANIFLPREARFFCGMLATTVKTSGEMGETAAGMFRPGWIIASFAVFLVIYLVFEYLLPALWPAAKGWGPSLIGLAVGMWMPMPFAASLMVGALVAQGIGRRWARIALLVATAVAVVLTLAVAQAFWLIAMILGAASALAHVLHRRTGPEWLDRNRNILVAGLAVGEGVVIGIFAALAALRNSLVSLPY